MRGVRNLQAAQTIDRAGKGSEAGLAYRAGGGGGGTTQPIHGERRGIAKAGNHDAPGRQPAERMQHGHVAEPTLDLTALPQARD